MTEESTTRPGMALMFWDSGATIAQAARLAWEDDVLTALAGSGSWTRET